VAPSTASGHLARLVEGRLLSVVASGRHRYYRLASAGVASLLERLMVVAGDGPPRHRPRSRCSRDMAFARTCYDHLAGRLGVAIADAMAARAYVVLGEEGGLVTEDGRAFLRRLGIAADPSPASRRAFCRPCLDWSERRWHLGGALGAAIAGRCFELGWIERRKDSRAVAVSATGKQALGDLLDIRL